jgi:hypothetical protein
LQKYIDFLLQSIAFPKSKSLHRNASSSISGGIVHCHPE